MLFRQYFRNHFSCYSQQIYFLGKLIKVLDKNPVKLIRQCIKNYLSICDIITNITQSDGILLGILIFCHILYLMSNSYKIISYSSSPSKKNNYNSVILFYEIIIIIYIF